MSRPPLISPEQLDATLAACNAIMDGLEWTGDGYDWNPKHGHYVERPRDAVARGAAAYRKEREQLKRDNLILRESVEQLQREANELHADRDRLLSQLAETNLAHRGLIAAVRKPSTN